MQFRQVDANYLLVLNKGELLVSTLTEFCHKQSIAAGWLSGIGAVLHAELGYYHLDRQEYEFQNLDQVLEIVSLSGNVALKNDRPFLHLHAVLSDEKLRIYGGHLREATIGGTCELILMPLAGELTRRLDDATGLSPLQL